MADTEGFDLAALRKRMDGSLHSLKGEFAGLRTGRASANLVEPVMVEAYGASMALREVGTVSVPEPRLIMIQVWDKGLVAAVDKAIRSAGLGLNPVVEGQTLRLPIPELNEERRAELTKVASRYAEQARVAVRNIRRDGMDRLKKLEKEGHTGKDEVKRHSDEIQALTDRFIAEIDAALKAKDAEIMQV